MSPISAFSQLLRLNNRAGAVLLAGLAVIAAAVIAASWNVDIRNAGIAGLYIALLGAVLFTIVAIVDNDTLKAVLAWFVVGLFILGSITIFLSVVLQSAHVLPPAHCLIRFWEDCPNTASANASRGHLLPVKFDKPVGYYIKRGNSWIEYPAYAPGQNFSFTQFRADDDYIYLMDRSRSKPNEPDNAMLVRLPLAGGPAQWSYQNPLNWIDLTVVTPESTTSSQN